MKILFVSGDLCDGGAQRVISIISSLLADRGHQVYLLLFSSSKKDYPVSENVVVHAMYDSYQEYKKAAYLHKMRLIRDYIKSIKPDVGIGFLQGGYAMWLASLGMRFPRIASARVSPSRMMHPKGVHGIVSSLWFRHADVVVLQNESQRKYAASLGWKNCCVIENPVSDLAEQYFINNYREKCTRFVMAGRLTAQKNYPLVIDAVKRIKTDNVEMCVDIFGQGQLDDELQTKIDEVGLSNTVHLKGWSKNIYEEYLNYDAFILSSDYEGMPNSLMEAMAVGLPCISTDCETGPRDMIQSGLDGYLVEPGNTEQMASAIRSLTTTESAEREEMGKKARDRMLKTCGLNVVGDKWENMLQAIVNQGNIRG